MSETTTGSADASGESGQPDYQAKYNGLQSAFQKRVNEFSAKETQWAEERQALEAKAAKVAEYEAKEAADREEAEALASYEALRDRFEQDPPTPQNPNATNYGAANPWSDPRPRKDAEERTESGWPT